MLSASTQSLAGRNVAAQAVADENGGFSDHDSDQSDDGEPTVECNLKHAVPLNVLAPDASTVPSLSSPGIDAALAKAISVDSVDFGHLHHQPATSIGEKLEESIIACNQLRLEESCTKPRPLRKIVLMSVTVAVGMLGILFGVLHSVGVFDRSAALKSLDSGTMACLESFSDADSDSDGFLAYDELLVFHKEASKLNESTNESSVFVRGPASASLVNVNDQVAEYILLADRDHSGTIDFSEYISMGSAQIFNMSGAATQQRGGAPVHPPTGSRRLLTQQGHHNGTHSLNMELEHKLMSEWDGGFDSDGSGRLNLVELEALLAAQGGKDAREEAEHVMNKFDANTDGELSIFEAEKVHNRDAQEVAHAAREIREDDHSRRLWQETACNGAASLCSKRFDEVAYATTHNSYNTIRSGYVYANHYETIQTQLEDGVRAFMLDLHVEHPGHPVYLCHGGYQWGYFCPLGKEKAADVLRAMREWLEAHPREVVTFILELGPAGSRPTTAQVEAVFLETGAGFRVHGVRDMLYDPTTSFRLPSMAAGATWPTLGDMIHADKRVVVLSPRPAWEAASWNLDRHHVRESPWSHKSREESGISVLDTGVTCSHECSASTAPPGVSIHLLNHFITYPTSAQYAKMMNFEDVLFSRVQHWKDTHAGHIPNFIAVDYYEIGNVFQVVDSLNEVAPRAWACRTVGRADYSKRFCCPSGHWWTTCSITGSCDKGSGQCSCNRDWEFGFDCSERKCQTGYTCNKWSWRCWNVIPGCCGWDSYTWWC